MRFLKDGPSIPDELLIARDEGRVVFFCGAGVSKARAELPGFFALANEVVLKLGVSADSAAYRMLAEARQFEKRVGTSVISADRIFGLLERDFHVRDIESAVAAVLRAPQSVDLSAHEVLLDLARTSDGRVQLVTTNFDLLFESCDAKLKSWRPPLLPNPSRHQELDGIIHLHGHVNSDYTGADGDGFVLSVSEFGHAYLSEGWATEFVKEIIDRYVVVFAGYTADDPPVQYLLEALNRNVGGLEGVFAFQSGLSGEATAKWVQRGVKTISYDSSAGHEVLWATLGAWARRARDPNAWYRSVIDLAKKGPPRLESHERGQIAHIISTVEGVREFAVGDSPPPADWLCVFDPKPRYERPRVGLKLGQEDEESVVDPFHLYGLDSDVPPKQINVEDRFTKRDIPEDAWDGLAANRLDLQGVGGERISSIRGSRAANVPPLLPRLFELGRWIAKVSDQPAAVWWAADQSGLHPDIAELIKWQLGYSGRDIATGVRQAWGYLLELWDQSRQEAHREFYDFKTVVDCEGWSRAVVRRYVAINRPYLEVKRSYWSGTRPPEPKRDITVRDLLSITVEYQSPVTDIEVPKEWLTVLVCGLRENLEYALKLETELGGYGLDHISPLVSEDGLAGSAQSHPHGLSRSVISFLDFFQRLIKADIEAAKDEVQAWPLDDETIFSRLRIWALGNAALTSSDDFGPAMSQLTNSAFWNRYHQRDLLLLLAKRWRGLPHETRRQIEQRLLSGPSRSEDDNVDDFKKRKAWSSLERLQWLASKGCEFTFDFDTEIKELQNLVPEWEPDHARKAADAMEGGGWVKTEKDYSALLDEPLENILKKAHELSAKREEFGVERDPFAGLCEEKPVRAFSALTNAARKNNYPEWAWRTFLYSPARKEDKPKFSAFVAERIIRYPGSSIAEFIHPVTDWILKVSKAIASDFPDTFDGIVAKLCTVVSLESGSAGSTIVRGDRVPDWATEAINSPAGKLAQAMFNDPRTNDLKGVDGLPRDWLVHVERLLTLNGDPRRHALVILAYNMNWLHLVDPEWTVRNVLSMLDGEDLEDQAAVLSGFLWRARLPNPGLYMLLKPHLLLIGKEQSSELRGYDEILAGVILQGWGTTDEQTKTRYVSNDELRVLLLATNDEVRGWILWHVGGWAGGKRDNEWSALGLEMIRNVWPRQKSVKTPEMSARLCDLAFSSTDTFPEMAEAVLPLLTTIDRDHMRLHNLGDAKEKIIPAHPEWALALLYVVLPDNVMAWPWDIQDVLYRIGEADLELKKDERLIELYRKWNSR